jgi:hypothetical protein
MQQLTPYQRYLHDPGARAALDAEVVRLRREAIDQYLVQPIARWLRSLVRPAPTSDSPLPPRGATWQISLDKNGTVVFNDVQDLEVELVLGSLWITQDGDIEDYVLGPGQRFRVRRQGATVLHALTDSSIQLTHRQARAAAGVAPAAPRRAEPGILGRPRALAVLASGAGRQPDGAPNQPRHAILASATGGERR